MKRIVLWMVFGLLSSAHAQDRQIRQPQVAQMPDLPKPVVLRDWKQVARDVDAFVCDFSQKGDYLPAPWWDRSRINVPFDVIAIPSYLGDSRQHKESNEYDAITCFGAVLGATKVGINKRDQNGKNYVEMLNAYFQEANGVELYLNRVQTKTGHTFWYELLPNILFYQVCDHYRDTPGMKKNMVRVADRWHEAVVALGGQDVNFDWTAYDFKTGKPVDNKEWKEADAAAAVAWIEYMAYTQTGNTNFLNAAEWAMGFLDRRDENPYYECLLPYGAYLAARMNAERGAAHQTEKLVNWVFNGDNRRKWGVTSGAWGEQDCAGLTGSIYPGHEYAFAMNTFLTAGVMLPIVRYDDRYAEAFGKWILNVAIHSRYFYSNAWKPDEQTCFDWAQKNDPQSCFAYEGIRKQGWTRAYPVADIRTGKGSSSGSWKEARYDDGKKQTLIMSRRGKLEHIWKLNKSSGLETTLVLWAEASSADSKYTVYYSKRRDRGWQEAFTFAEGGKRPNCWKKIDPEYEGDLYVKVVGDGDERDQLSVENLYIQTKLDKSPYLMGDPTMMGWGKTDIGLYGSVFVGLLGAIVEPTDIEGILQLDCRVTESFAEPSYPTHLYYNPHRETQTVTVPLLETPVDLYDAVSNEWIAKSQSGSTSIRIEKKSAVLLVQCPAGGAVVTDCTKTILNGIVIDYNNGRGD